MSLQPRDPRVRARHQQVSVEAPSIPSSKRGPSFAMHQKVEGLWDEESWFPGVVHNVVQKKGHANEYGVTFDDGDKGVYLSQQLRKHPDTVDGSPRFLLQPEVSSSSESDDESEDGSEPRSSNEDIESECTIYFLYAFEPPTDIAYFHANKQVIKKKIAMKMDKGI